MTSSILFVNSRELRRKHGDLVTLNIFGQKVIVVCGHQTLTEVLERKAYFTVEHPVVFGYTEYFESSGTQFVLILMLYNW